MFWDAYITSDKSIPSRSGLYATNLPGVTLALFDSLAKDEQADYLECWNDLYTRAIANFVSDMQAKLADRFHVDLKLTTRETSAFTKDVTHNGAILLQYDLPKYGRTQILTVEVNAVAAGYFTLLIHDTDTSGELLFSKTYSVVKGRNVLDVFTDFEACSLHCSQSTGSPSVAVYQSINKRFYTGHYFLFTELSCTFGLWGGDYRSSVTQVNGGGLNVKFVVYCSVEKFIQENINLFKMVLLDRIALDLMRERILSDRFNRFTTLTEERAKQLMDLYQSEYDMHLVTATRNLKVQEDEVCFACRSSVRKGILLP